MEKMELKCKKCCHYYRTMAAESGYNPYPCCHLYEGTGRRADIITQSCFERRKRRMKNDSKS